MAQSTDELLADPAAEVHADAMEAMHAVHPTPVPEGLKALSSSSESKPAPSPKSDYSVARKLRSHKEDVDAALKSTSGM